MIIFQHKRQPWRTLSGAYQRRGWFFHHVRTFVNGCQTVVHLPRHAWRVGMLPVIDYGLKPDSASRNKAGLDCVNPHVVSQYTVMYGPFATGDYPIGSSIAVPGISGEVIWSYLPYDGRGLVYVVDDDTGQPVELLASQVVERVTPWT